MENSKFYRKIANGLLVTWLSLGLGLSVSLSAQASDVAEKDLGAVEQPANETDAIGEQVAAVDEAPANKAKEDFSSGFKGVGNGFKNGVKATGRGFKKAGTVMGKGFKTAGTTMGRGFKKAGTAIKNFFTGKRSSDSIEEQDIRAEGNAAGAAESDYDNMEKNTQEGDDLELEIEDGSESKGNDWV